MFAVYEDDEKVFEAIKSGANGYLLKNSEPAFIESALKDLYNGGAPMSTLIARKVISVFRQNKETISSFLLSTRENQILSLFAQGLLYKEIADQLNISISTVRQHIHKVYEKLHDLALLSIPVKRSVYISRVAGINELTSPIVCKIFFLSKLKYRHHCSLFPGRGARK